MSHPEDDTNVLAICTYCLERRATCEDHEGSPSCEPCVDVWFWDSLDAMALQSQFVRYVFTGEPVDWALL